MKFSNSLAAIFLCSVTFISCTDEFDLEFPAPVPPANVQVNLTLVPLNTTEQKLRGEWFLRSLVTRDTVYNDSLYNHLRSVRFTEFAWPGQTMPILDDYTNLFTKATPDSIFYLPSNNETFQAPDPSTLIIYFDGGVPQGGSTIRLQITYLEIYNLNLRDSVTGKEWKFVR